MEDFMTMAVEAQEKYISLSKLEELLDDRSLSIVRGYLNNPMSNTRPAGAFSFGKYKDQSIVDIAEADPQYCRWLMKQEWMGTDKPEEFAELQKYKSVWCD